MRIVFSDLEKSLLDFDNLWGKERENGSKNGAPLATITATLTDYFHELYKIIEPKYFANIVLLCLDTALMRYLIFLRDLATKVAI